MIQQQSYVDIADNSGAKVAMCIKVLRGSSSKGKFKRKVAHVGDIIICAVKKAMPGADENAKQGKIIRCVVVRTKQPTIRPDGSYVRFDHNAAVVIDKENNPVGTRIFGAVARELRDKNFMKIVSLASEVV
jgi:large subunit ribosomal protein L14